MDSQWFDPQLWLYQLSDACDRRASSYSKGMRQKVGLALAIAKQACALLLDEPTLGLDPQASAEFHTLIVGQRDAGAAVLMVTHDLFRAREVGSRIGLMREGKLRRMIDAADITASDLERLYLEEMGQLLSRPGLRSGNAPFMLSVQTRLTAQCANERMAALGNRFHRAGRPIWGAKLTTAGQSLRSALGSSGLLQTHRAYRSRTPSRHAGQIAGARMPPFRRIAEAVRELTNRPARSRPASIPIPNSQSVQSQLWQ